MTMTDLDFCVEAEQLIHDRHVHGRCEYTPKENWIAVLVDKLWFGLAQPVRPADIIHKRTAVCSQMAIMFQDMVKWRGLQYASICWPPDPGLRNGHFATIVKIDGVWRMFDPDMMPRPQAPTLQDVMHGALIYPHCPQGSSLADRALLGLVETRHYNTFPAPRAALFQTISGKLSRLTWPLVKRLWRGQQ